MVRFRLGEFADSGGSSGPTLAAKAEAVAGCAGCPSLNSRIFLDFLGVCPKTTRTTRRSREAGLDRLDVVWERFRATLPYDRAFRARSSCQCFICRNE
jgi:hypothetical protein